MKFQAEDALGSPLGEDFAFTPQPDHTARSTGRRGSIARSSVSPAEMRSARAVSKRATAAEWLASVTGEQAVSHERDDDFRAALGDGVLLCKLLNALQPGAIPRVIEESSVDTATGEVIQSFENVSNFITAAQATAGVAFSACDLDPGAEGERPQVVECLLSLRDWHLTKQSHEARTPAPDAAPVAPGAAAAAGGEAPALTPSLLHPAAGLAAALPSPRSAGSAGSGVPSPAAAPFSFTPAAQHFVQKHGAAGVDAPDGLNYLMRSCTQMLKQRMGVPATPPVAGAAMAAAAGAARAGALCGLAGLSNPEIALDAVGPVLETVLANLTSEYEKRLLAKDQESKLAHEAQERLRRTIAGLQADAAAWRRRAEEAAAALPDAAASETLSAAERAEFGALRTAAAAGEAELTSARRELAALQASAAAAAAAADGELGALRAEVGRYRGLEERYRSIQEENRSLYNTVQDLRGAIRVFCRVRPRGATGDAAAPVVEVGEEGSLDVFSHKHNKWSTFKFDRVFGEGSAQEEVYEETKPLIRSVLDGYNVCIFAYGQTGSGKTHTMSGTDIQSYAGRGINYRALDDLFDLHRERGGEVSYRITVQLLEIYNETLRDLLVPEAEARQQRSLALNHTQRSGSNVPDAIQVEVSTTEEVLRVMDLGSRNRAVAETRMNERSSRSHQVLTVMVEGRHRASHARTSGCLHLIDLAGSERVGKSGAEGQQLLEAQHINKSLSALGNVMHALASKAPHVPFRDSKLTQLLQDSLAGQAKAMMFMHIAPEMSSASETLSTLHFGKGVTEVTLGAAKKNSDSGALIELREKAAKCERQADAARAELGRERERSAALAAEVEALRRAAAEIPAYRPGAAAAAAPLAAPRGLTPRGATPIAAKPYLSAGGTPTLSGSATRPPMAKLNLSRLRSSVSEEGGAEENAANATPQSSRAPGSRIPMPTPPSGPAAAALSRRGSLTARPSLPKLSPGLSASQSGSMPSFSSRPQTARESPAMAAARRSAAGALLSKAPSGGGDAYAVPLSARSSRVSVGGASKGRWM